MGNSSNPQLRSARKLLPARSPGIDRADSWQGDFSAAFVRPHALALHNAPQTGVTNSSRAITQTKTLLARAKIARVEDIGTGYAMETAGSTRNEIVSRLSQIAGNGGDGGSPTRDLGVRSASLYASELRPRCSSL